LYSPLAYKLRYRVKMRKMRQCSFHAGTSLCAIIYRGRTKPGLGRTYRCRALTRLAFRRCRTS
jgi:hypothetical protein